jgi:protein pelota
VATSIGGRPGVNEVLNEGLGGELLAEHSLVNEVRLLGECWRRLATDGAVAYGKEELQRAKEEGAIETMLISAETLRSEDSINGASWEEWVIDLPDTGAKLVQCSLEHDDGQQLLSFGGAIALLRFKI